MNRPGGRAPHLIVVDMQPIFASGPWGAPRFADALAVVRQLVERFSDTAVFTRFVAPERPGGAWQSYYDRWPFALQSPDAPDYQLVEDLAGHAGSTVDATTFGKWSALAATKNFRPGDTVLVCGVSTDCCVLSTVLAAADAGMNVRVVADGCAGADDASHHKALDLMSLYEPLVQIVSSDDVLD